MDSASISTTLSALASYTSSKRNRAAEKVREPLMPENNPKDIPVGLIEISEKRGGEYIELEYVTSRVCRKLLAVLLTYFHSVVFVHGLQGHPFNTWRSQKAMWPQDFLRTDFPTARIFTFGYSSLLDEGTSPSIKGLGQLLLGDLSRHRDVRINSRPIVFVAHSSGGLIVKSVSKTACRIHWPSHDIVTGYGICVKKYRPQPQQCFGGNPGDFLLRDASRRR